MCTDVIDTTSNYIFARAFFLCVYTVFITDFQLFIFLPLLSPLPLLPCLFFPPCLIFSCPLAFSPSFSYFHMSFGFCSLCVLFFICPSAFSPPLIHLFPDYLSDLNKDPEDQTLSPSPVTLAGSGLSSFHPIFSPPFAPADFSTPPSSCHTPPWCLFCYRMRNKNVVPLLPLIYLLCLGE